MSLKDPHMVLSLQNGGILTSANSSMNFKNGSNLKVALNEHLEQSLNISLNGISRKIGQKRPDMKSVPIKTNGANNSVLLASESISLTQKIIEDYTGGL